MWAPGSGGARLPLRRRPAPGRSSARPPWPLLLLVLAAVGPARAWESADLELFDLVEEVQSNFYEFLGVQQVSAGRGGPGPPVLPPRSNFGTCAWGCSYLSFGSLEPILPSPLGLKEERCG